MQLTIEALQAAEGDCLLLEHVAADGKPTRILIDGGSRGIYRRVLRPRLDALRHGDRLELRMVLVSHIDGDHISGILDLFTDLERLKDDGEEPFCHIGTLWHNAFESLHGGEPARHSAAVGAALGPAIPAGLDASTAAVVASVRQGAALRNAAERLDIPINRGAQDELVRAPVGSVRRVPVAPGLTFTILGPRDAQLLRLHEEWQKASDAHPVDPAARAADYLNRTVPNLSSIVILAEAERPGGAPVRVLLTGDAGGDHILQALSDAGLSHDGSFEVDLLKVQHHGSNHSVTQEFFERVTAPRYVISGNGTYDLPHADTLAWLSAARSKQPYDVYMTNREGGSGLTAKLDRFLAEEASNEPAHRYHFRAADELSITVPIAS